MRPDADRALAFGRLGGIADAGVAVGPGFTADERMQDSLYADAPCWNPGRHRSLPRLAVER